MARAEKKYDERDETQRSRDATLEATLRNERSSWETHLRDLDDYIKPGRLRLNTSETNRGDKKHSKIINNTGTIAHRTARSGLHSGMTSPARPWFQLTTPDPDLAEFGPVKEWLYTVTQRMRTLFLRSNIYNSLPTLYGDQLQFGTGAMGVFSDDEDFMRSYTYAPGSYWLAAGARLVVDTFLREIPMTVRQVVESYGDKDATPATRWEPFSATIKNLYERGNLEERVEVMHVITPNSKYDAKHYDSKFKRFRSCHYEKGGNEDKYLRESGYRRFPIMAPRWDITGEDVYGRGPGMDALGDIKALQILERRKLNAIEKMINPPLIGPAGLANRKVSLLSGDLLAYDVRSGMEGLKPIHETQLPIQHVTAAIGEHEGRVNSAFYANLFLRFIMDTRNDRPTARQVDEEAAEKLTELGPTLERENDELFDPLIDWVFEMMESDGMIPEPPPELEGVDVPAEYVSVMAQAQKTIGSAGLERFSGFAGNIGAVNPEVYDNVDMDEALREYGTMWGVKPTILRDEDKVKSIREQRSKAKDAAIATERAQQLAQGAKTLSETDVATPGSALNALVGSAVA